MLVNRRTERSLKHRRVSAVRGPRRHGSGALATVAAVAELVVMETAGKLRLLQVGRDMLVGHFLHPRLEQISFLHTVIVNAHVLP